MNWEEIFKSLGFVSIISGLVVWLIKQLGEHFINRRFKVYEQELNIKSDDYKHKLDKLMENHKSELSIVYAKASKLHDRRLEIISELYSKLVELDEEMHIMTALWKQVTGDEKVDEENEQKRVDKAANSYNNFHSFFNQNKIFFSEKTCETIAKLKTDYYDSLWDYTTKKRMGFTDFKLNYENAKNASEKVRKEIPPILKRLEDDFRAMIGVEIEKQKDNG